MGRRLICGEIPSDWWEERIQYRDGVTGNVGLTNGQRTGFSGKPSFRRVDWREIPHSIGSRDFVVKKKGSSQLRDEPREMRYDKSQFAEAELRTTSSDRPTSTAIPNKPSSRSTADAGSGTGTLVTRSPL